MTWPNHARFPTNRPHFTVRSELRNWLLSAEEMLIITGYSSLDELIGLIYALDISHQDCRVLIGNEPFISSSNRPNRLVPDAMKSYWLERGLSLEQCPRIEMAVRRLRNNDVTVRIANDAYSSVHAKIFSSNKAVMIGSSNYTRAGLSKNLEANVVFTLKDKSFYAGANELAEALWDTGKPCNEWLADLIESLMKVVSWQEALARAGHELFKGDWLDQLLVLVADQEGLWPTQREGIAQALYILERNGSVLFADATGSGKTKTGAFLLQVLAVRARQHGELLSLCGVVCPPSVRESWLRETAKPGCQTLVESSGQLGRESVSIKGILSRANFLLVDEAHNYHNMKSERTKALLSNQAEKVLLFTATPINRGTHDLIALINILGADNINPDSLKILERYLQDLARHKGFNDLPKVRLLADEIKQFTVRRTVSYLKQRAHKSPHLYCDSMGNHCNYPKVVECDYAHDESAADRLVLAEIREEASRLIGIHFFANPIKPGDRDDKTDQQLMQRLSSSARSIRGLAAYAVVHSLRCSKFALIEYLSGSALAAERADLVLTSSALNKEGLMARLLTQMNNFPAQVLPWELLPDFLQTKECYQEAIAAELATYDRILNLTSRLSNGRELAKAKNIHDISLSHQKVVVFGERIIALTYIHKLLNDLDVKHELLLATSQHEGNKKRVCSVLSTPVKPGKYIALCSDSMSEGINLQAASALVMLDKPSTIRAPEQRIGRLQRLNSPHQAIEVFWPSDAEELALQRDIEFLRRHGAVKRLIGGNYDLSEDYRNHSIDLGLDDFDEADFESTESPEVELTEHLPDDAFDPVRQLFEGQSAIVPSHIMEAMSQQKGQAFARVSLISSVDKPWAFFCFAGTKATAPKWLVVSEDKSQSTAVLSEVVTFLRANLSSETQAIQPTAAATARMNELYSQYKSCPELALSRMQNAYLILLNDYVAFMLKRSDQPAHIYLQLLEILPTSVANDRLVLEPIDALQLLNVIIAFKKLTHAYRISCVRKSGHRQLITCKRLLKPLMAEPIPDDVFTNAMAAAIDISLEESQKLAVAIFAV